jgi:isoleucyl-tRNA synthetase
MFKYKTMPFSMMAHDLAAIEEQIIQFWKKNSIYHKIKLRNSKGKPFYYLDGPPYTSGRIHIGHAWGKALRDMVMRYKRMQGYDVFDRAGFDMHGLPTSHKVQAKFNLESPGSIKEFGYGRFTEECKKLALENMKQMIDDFERLGVWMDFENPYMPINNDYIEGVWWLIKKAHDNGRLYEGYRTLHWDPKDETALSKHELEYQSVVDESIFVKFPLKNDSKAFLVAWTTTPWTIPYNLAVMVHPDREYSYCKVKGEMTLIVAKERAQEVLMKAGYDDYSIIKTVKGKDLEGMEYEHPLRQHITQFIKIKEDSPKSHTVVCSSEHVETTSGSGLVHCAPGCGPEDYEVGYNYGIKPFNTLDGKGIVTELGIMTGLVAKKDDRKFTKIIEEHDALLHKEPYKHDYPFAERSKQPVVFRITKQWFLRIEDIKDKMKELNATVHWVPEWAGKNQFHNWIDNLRDNSITKQIHWGTPFPVWRSSTGKIIVIGSLDELKKLSRTSIPISLHKPYIDEVILEKDGEEYYRIPDVLDVWVDAGSASWLSLDFPKRKDLFERYYPADFIVEGKDQIRGWFNLLLVASIIGFDNISFRACYMHGFINDAQGRKMSKSLGNIISPNEVIEKYGADIARTYMIGSASAGEDMNYNFDDIEVKMKNFNVLQNLVSLLCSMAKGHELPIKPIKSNEGLDSISKAMMTRLHDTIRVVTELYDDYRLEEIPGAIESLYLDLSRFYLQFMREDISDGTERVKDIVSVYSETVRGVLLMLSPIAPHLTEHLYLQVKDIIGMEEDSVHLSKFPRHNESMIDKRLLDTFGTMQSIRTAILSARDKAGIGVRWPLSEAKIITRDERAREALALYSEELCRQLNIRKIVIAGKMEGTSLSKEPDLGLIGRTFKKDSAEARKVIESLSEEDLQSLVTHGSMVREGFHITSAMVRVSHSIPDDWVGAEFDNGQAFINTILPEELQAEGYARELARAIQDARKEMSLVKRDRVDVIIEKELMSRIGSEWAGWASKRTGSHIIIGRPEEKDAVSLAIRNEKYMVNVKKA